MEISFQWIAGFAVGAYFLFDETDDNKKYFFIDLGVVTIGISKAE